MALTLSECLGLVCQVAFVTCAFGQELLEVLCSWRLMVCLFRYWWWEPLSLGEGCLLGLRVSVSADFVGTYPDTERSVSPHTSTHLTQLLPCGAPNLDVPDSFVPFRFIYC